MARAAIPSNARCMWLLLSVRFGRETNARPRPLFQSVTLPTTMPVHSSESPLGGRGAMPFGLPVAFALLAQAAAASPAPGSDARYGPVPAAAPPPKVSTEPTRECVNQNQNPNGNEIIVCAIKPEGYRLPPDIVEARRLKKQGITGPPHNPHESYADRSCANVGPMGCRGTQAINLL